MLILHGMVNPCMNIEHASLVGTKKYFHGKRLNDVFSSFSVRMLIFRKNYGIIKLFVSYINQEL